MNPAVAMALVFAAFALLIVPVALLQKRGWLSAELSRKVVHIGMGLVTAAFPCLFTEAWPVLLLTGGFVTLLVALRTVPILRARFGSALCGVERASWGDLYFPIAIGGLFVLTHHEPVNFVIPVLILALADAAAALIGTRFGRHRYLADEGEKSWEGSGAFLAVAFVCTLVPLLVTGTPLPHAALTALCVGFLTMLLEATAWRGLDNLFVPFSTLVMLRLYRDVPDFLLLRHLGGLACLAAAHLVFRRRVLLREGTFLGALVLVYLCWTLGSARWSVGPILVLLSHPLVNLGRPAGTEVWLRSHLTLLAFALPSLAWLFADRLLGLSGFAPFNIAFGAHLALTGVSLWRTPLRKPGWLLVFPAAASGWLLLVLPWWLLGYLSARSALQAALAFLAVVSVFHVLYRCLEHRPIRQWNLRALLAALASLAGT